jgi:glycerol-3-phosphate dehydrogenase
VDRRISVTKIFRLEMLRSKSDKIWDCIVVGAGIEGSNTARYSASLGKNTLCLEQVNGLLF